MKAYWMNQHLSFYGVVDVFLLKEVLSFRFVPGEWPLRRKQKEMASWVHKETDGVRPPVYTTSLNCCHIKHTHSGILTITRITMTQTREWGNVKRKSRMLVSFNGMSGAVVKCSNVSFTIFFPAVRLS